MEVAVTASKEKLNGENYAIWQAAFIEDAVCMHLATKRGFSNAIYSMLKDSKIRDVLEDDEHFGALKVQELENRLKKVLGKNLK